MRKHIITQEHNKESSPAKQTTLDLQHLAQVELTSEDEAFPIEGAFTAENGAGWLAAQPGEQTIRLLFDDPQQISRIKLTFREVGQERTQEFVLRWLPIGGQSYQEVVRQQFTFSPPYTSEESEEYAVNLNAVSALELTIIPDISNSAARASLALFQLS